MKYFNFFLIAAVLIFASCQNTIKVKNKEYIGDAVTTKVLGFGKEQQVATMNAQSDLDILMNGAAYSYTLGKVKINNNSDNPSLGKAEGYFNSIKKKISDKLFVYEFREISSPVYILSGNKFIQKSEIVLADPNLRVFPSVITDAVEKKYKKNEKAFGAAYIRKISYTVSEQGKIKIQYEVLIVEENIE
jgi:hypothetical protein